MFFCSPMIMAQLAGIQRVTQRVRRRQFCQKARFEAKKWPVKVSHTHAACPVGKECKNWVRYVPQSELAPLRDAITGYRRFLALTQQNADQIIRRSRAERQAASLTRRTVKPRN